MHIGSGIHEFSLSAASLLLSPYISVGNSKTAGASPIWLNKLFKGGYF